MQNKSGLSTHEGWWGGGLCMCGDIHWQSNPGMVVDDMTTMVV
jgi:hypothetical protein